MAIDRAIQAWTYGRQVHQPDECVSGDASNAAAIEIAQDLDGLEQLLAVGICAEAQVVRTRGVNSRAAVAITELWQVRVVLSFNGRLISAAKSSRLKWCSAHRCCRSSCCCCSKPEGF
jgi:hypothetical protein